jgi:TonB-linked SusC/RagA family outer membrane protein
MQLLSRQLLWVGDALLFSMRKSIRPALLLVILLAGAYFRLHAQVVTMNLKSESITRAFRIIEVQTGFSVVYAQSQIKNAVPVTINVTKQNLSLVLQEIFKGQPFTYTVSNRIIAVKLKEEIIPRKREDRIKVMGKVTDASGRPLSAVSVVIPSTPFGAMTNMEGEYILNEVPENANLVFTYIGYERLQISVDGRTQINATLTPEVKDLNQMVVIGYGTTTKKKNTGSVSSITAEEISKQPVANPLNALQGRVPGAVVFQSNGLPGSRVTIQIRGVNSLGSGQQPLYIIDGIPFNMIDQSSPATNDVNSNGLFGANRGISPFSIINPNDIERMDILKDADATAIYGTKAANGVVLITTKKGKAGKTKLDVNVYRGEGKVARFIPMMNTEQYLAMRKEAYANDGLTPNAANAPDLLVWDQHAYTDWQRKLIGGTATTTDAQATISGGDHRTRYLFSAGYHRETTVLPGDFDDNRMTVRFNADHSSLDRKFNASFNATYSYNKGNLLYTDPATVYNLPPNMPTRNADGSLFWNANFTNPESYLLQTYISKTNNLMANTILRYTILPGLEVKTSFSFSNMAMDQNQQFPANAKNPIGTTPTNSADFSSLTQQAWTIEPQATYTRDILKGRLQLLLGGTLQSSENKTTKIRADNYSNPALLSTPQGAGTYISITAPYTLYRYNSVFGRINYDWDSKYILNINFRRDGSSRFGPGHRFGNFGSVGGAWLFSNEDFIASAIPVLSFGKLRASYGLTGSDQIADYQYITLFNTSSAAGGYQGNAVLTPSRINNPDLHWETNKKFEVGLETGWLKDRINFNVNFYQNRSGNQLGFLSLASQAGFNAYTNNFDALIENKGWELELNTTNISNKWLTWKTFINLTIPSTKLLEASESYFYFNQFSLGKPLSYVMKYIYRGVDPETGKPMYQDFGKDSLTFTPNFATDRQMVGYTAPKFYGGINNTFTIKNFEVSFFIQFTKQDGNIRPSGTPGVLSNGNQPTLWLDRWSAGNKNSSLPKATTTSSIYSAYGSSTATWGDASFVRFRNAVIAWSFPGKIASKLKMNNLRVYVQGQNLFTWTKNKYVSDPETIATINQSPVVMPPLRVITAGINCSF